MAIKKLRPITPGQRHKQVVSTNEITASRPEKSLIVAKRRTGGRNNSGKMTMRYIGGGHTERLSGGRMEGYGGNHLMGAARKLTQHCVGMILIEGLFQNFAIKQAESIGAQHRGQWKLLLEQLGKTGSGFFTRQALRTAAGRAAGSTTWTALPCAPAETARAASCRDCVRLGASWSTLKGPWHVRLPPTALPPSLLSNNICRELAWPPKPSPWYRR